MIGFIWNKYRSLPAETSSIFIDKYMGNEVLLFAMMSGYRIKDLHEKIPSFGVLPNFGSFYTCHVRMVYVITEVCVWPPILSV